MKICVLGLGYIGLPTACILALNGHYVVGVDINKDIIKKINKGDISINENTLKDTVKKLIFEKKFIVKNKLENADFFIICVPTPLNNKFSCDLSYIVSALKSILSFIEFGNTVIIESTIPPGTTETVIKPLLERKGFKIGKDIYLAYCPERVLPGNIMNEIVYNDRIIGGVTKSCGIKAYNLYKSFVKGHISMTNATTAEMIKLVENIYRDVNIALANELSIICNKLKINSLSVLEMANKHPRVNILTPGPGVGGHCLPIDPYFIMENKNDSLSLISLSRRINENMPKYIVSIVKKITKNISNPKITIWGITYKGNVNDIRNSPSIDIINKLKKENFNLSIYDPLVDNIPINYIELSSKEDSLKNSNLLLLLADHNEFKTLELENEIILKNMKNPIILDAKNILNPKLFSNKNILVYNFGNFHLVK